MAELILQSGAWHARVLPDAGTLFAQIEHWPTDLASDGVIFRLNAGLHAFALADHGGFEAAAQRHRFVLIDLDAQGARRSVAPVAHRRATSRADAKNDAATAPSDSASNSSAMRSAPARSTHGTRS